MADPDAPAPRLSRELTELMRIAGDLRDLPSADFRARLRAALLAAARGGAAPADALGDRDRFAPKAHNVVEAAGSLAAASWRELTRFNQCQVGLFRFSGKTPWERHTGGDELLINLDGEVELTTLTDDGPVTATVPPGSLFVCPRGLWHRQVSRRAVTQLYATPSHTTEISRADDPRREDPAAVAAYSERIRREHPEMFGGRAGGSAPAADYSYGHEIAAPPGTDDRRPGARLPDRLVPHDVKDALRGLPELSMRFLATIDQCTIGVCRYSTMPHWERHPDGDELLYVIDGALEITILSPDGPVDTVVSTNSLVVCPRGLWHLPRPRPHVSMLFATPGRGTEHSDEPPAHGG